jgi:hypothetical protein
MAMAKRQQPSAVLYTLITFITLFVLSIAFAVIYYVKFEEQRKLADDAKTELEQVANATEVRNLNQIVGSITPRSSALSLMVKYFDQLIISIQGGPLGEASADVKFNEATEKIKQVLKPIIGQIGIEPNDSNLPSMIRAVQLLEADNQRAKDERNSLQLNYDDLYKKFENEVNSNRETTKKLNADIDKSQEQVNQIKAEYSSLENLLQQTTDEKVQNLRNDLKAVKTENENLKDELLKARAELKMTKEMMERAKMEVEQIKPLPDSNAPAYALDGEVILVDPQAKIVHINIGSDDGVYRGLTFAVYNKNLPIPVSGEGKAEIEIFDVGKTISAARITTPVSARNPIIVGDIIANLIWSKNRTNNFVVKGDFEYGDEEKIKKLIENWGSRVENTITINTDFVVLGQMPNILPKPSLEQQDLYPTALAKYEDSKKRNEEYKQILEQAKTLSIPIFNTERFLYFTGYKEKAGKPGAF